MQTFKIATQLAFAIADSFFLVLPCAGAGLTRICLGRNLSLQMYSLYGFDGADFSRLTQQLVFAFLGGYLSMDDLPCLGDLAIRIDGFPRTTSISINSYSKSSQAKTLDQNGNHRHLSAISMNSDLILRIMDDLPKSVKSSECDQDPIENISIVLDSLDPLSPPEHTSQSTDEIDLLPENSINAHLIRNKSVMEILNLDFMTTTLPFQQDDFPGNVSKIIILSLLAPHAMDFNSLASNSVPITVFENLAHKIQKIGENQNIETQEYDLHKHALTSGNLQSQFHRHHKNLEDFPVSNISPAITSENRPISDVNTFKIPNPGTLMDYLYGDLEIPQFLDAESSAKQLEDSCCIIESNGGGPTFSIPDLSELMNFLYGDLESPVFLSSESTEEEVPIYAEYDGNYSKVEVTSQSADHTSGESHQCPAMCSSAIPETIVGLMTESLCDSNGFTNGMDFERGKISSSCQFEEDSSKISDSKLSYHQDDFNVADPSNKYKSEAHTALATEPKDPLPKNPTNFVPAIGPLLYKSEEDEENMTTDLLPFTSNTDEPSLMDKNSTRNSYKNPEIYYSSLCCDQKVCLLGDCYSEYDPEVEDLSGCMHSRLFCSYENIVNTKSLPIKSNNGSLIGAFKENEMTPTSSVSVGCNGERISLDSSFFDSSDHDDLLEMYGLSNQNQYTDIGCSCESPSWPGKLEGQLQNSQTCLASNLTNVDTPNEILTADSSLFPANTDETSVMNKNRTDEIYERNSENSVSLCHLNQMECALETSRIDFGQMDCLPLLHSCSDRFENSIEYQSLQNDFKFAFPDPSTLKDFFYGTLDSPQFLASELLGGEIDNLHYPSLFGDYEQGGRTEEADLSDKMIFDQLYSSSINKFSILNVCSVKLLDVTSYLFNISDHDEFLESYGIKDQDQFMDGDWTCDSPTWPGKM